MTSSKNNRGLKLLALLAIILAVVLLLIPQATNHAPVLVFLFVPIFLFLLPDALAPQPLPATTIAFPHQLTTRPTLFQRPPPANS